MIKTEAEVMPGIWRGFPTDDITITTRKILEFGNGDVLIVPTTQEGLDNGIAFIQGESGRIGRKGNKIVGAIEGNLVDDVPAEVVFRFSKSESVLVLKRFLDDIYRELLQKETEQLDKERKAVQNQCV